jgi:uncharacterized RDD family membrane protein YckC
MASDGRWYPPHLHPNYLATLPPPPSPPSIAAPVTTPIAPSEQSPGPSATESPSAVVASAASWAEFAPPLPTYPPGYGPPPGQPMAPGYVLAPTVVGMPGSTIGAPPAFTAGPTDVIDPALQLRLAPWWKRLIAVVVDAAVIGTVLLVFFVIIGALASNSTTTTNSSTTSSGADVAAGLVALFVFSSVPNLLYVGIMNGSRRGQTLGKMAMGIAVRDARTGGQIGTWRGIGRYAITIVFEVVGFIPYLLDSLAPLWDGRRQAWHDRIAHSVVIEVRA